MTFSLPRIYISVLFLVIAVNAFGQVKVSNLDFSYLYRDGEGVDGEIVSSYQDSIASLLIKLNKPIDSLKKYTASYSVINSLEDEIESRIVLNSLSSYFQYEDGKSSYYGLRVRVNSGQYFVLWLTDTLKKVRYPIIKKFVRPDNAAELILYRKNFNAPILSNYIAENSSIRISTIEGQSTKINMQYYDYHFLPSSPPMSGTTDSSRVEFTFDRLASFQTNDTINFTDRGLYYIAMEGSRKGQSIIVTEPQYPKVGDFDGLVEALRYLATDEEYLKMSTSFNKKELFDKFWLNNTKSEDKARIAVREYYQRVRAANEFFTSYKEGWKSDRGMIYIIFGPPNRVFKTDNSEMWIYEKTFELPRVSFGFIKVETAFTDKHYVLERKSEYQNLWFRTVDLWRTGKKEY